MKKVLFRGLVLAALLLLPVLFMKCGGGSSGSSSGDTVTPTITISAESQYNL